MNDWSTFDSDGSSVQLVIESLSHLRHLVIPLFLTVAAPQVRTLDCFISEKNYHELKGENANRITGGDILPLLSEEVRKNCFPNLQSFRLIERGLLELPFIHSLLPRFNSDEYRFQFPGVDIRASPSALWGWSTGDIRCISPAADDLSDSSSGTDYLWEPSSESESEDDDEESEDDGEDESEGSLLWDYDPTDATIGDEETALEAWRTSRRVDHGASDIESDSEIESENEA
ncbi:hypothetical protein D9757_006085 [Collybiopsis confluens]|uniref:Uncharacterized protein n=1 Tax=Collybiopsis confluens TaxID=2823264 RepID=A0A8H5HHR0_9AGAR|nr:hypothetical protein D9757_006085 [Collybiopsis confluens]